MEIFQTIVEMNNSLRVDEETKPNYSQLGLALSRARRLAPHDNLIALVSDFAGADDESARLILQMVQHNDLFAGVVHDPMAMDQGGAGRLVVTEGELQVELDLAAHKVREPVLKFTRGRLSDVMEYLKKLAIPVMPVHTGEDVVDQVKSLLGQRQGARQPKSSEVAESSAP